MSFRWLLNITKCKCVCLMYLNPKWDSKQSWIEPKWDFLVNTVVFVRISVIHILVMVYHWFIVLWGLLEEGVEEIVCSNLICVSERCFGPHLRRLLKSLGLILLVCTKVVCLHLSIPMQLLVAILFLASSIIYPSFAQSILRNGNGLIGYFFALDINRSIIFFPLVIKSTFHIFSGHAYLKVFWF